MKIKGAKKVASKPVMQEYLSSRNKHELSGGFDYYKTGISKISEFNQAKKRAGKISMIAEGIELAEQKKDFFSIYR
jgi:hypothetical protein|tara:strand:+ start:160 stop:387 length:228 start_codon:yes stop_codon:yes gene_type:complete